MKKFIDRTGLIALVLIASYMVMGIIICSLGMMLWHNSNQGIPVPINEPNYTTVINNIPNKVYKMRVTAYHNSSNKKSATNETVIAGKTAAVSPACIDLLGEKVYIEGHGIRHVNDLAAKWLDDKFGVCTIDLAVGSKSDTSKIGSNIKTVVKLNN